MNWLRQTSEDPLFPDLLWARPERNSQAGKLLIIGGNKFGFSAPANAYAAAEKAGSGSTRVLLPQSLKRTVGALMEADFGSSTPSGSFSRQALSEALDLANWAQGVLLAGDYGRNSETAIMLEGLIRKYQGPIVVAGDGVDYFLNSKSLLLDRKSTALVINLGKLQKLARSNRPSTPVLHNMDLIQMATVLADWTNGVQAAFITAHLENFIVAANGEVSITKINKETNWQTDLAAYVSVWLLQQPDKTFESLNCSVYEYVKANAKKAVVGGEGLEPS
jgi:hypothetical protein